MTVSVFVVVDRVLDDDSAIVMSHGKTVIAEGAWERTERFELADGDVVLVPRVLNEPIDVVRNAWAAIIPAGRLLAMAKPRAIQGDALCIDTPSATVSHHLAFLEREITAAVNALRVATITRLRFRIVKAVKAFEPVL